MPCGINLFIYFLPEHVLSNVRRLAVWGKIASNIVNFLLMGSPLMVHGFSKNHSISVGNNGTATLTVDTTVCLIGRKKERTWVTNLSSIMGNGRLSAYMESRF